MTDEPRVQFVCVWGGAVGARTVREHAAFMNVRLRSFALGDLCAGVLFTNSVFMNRSFVFVC